MSKEKDYIIKNGVKLYTVETVFKEVSKSKEFQVAEKEEAARLKLLKELREIRKKENLTQREIAERANMPQSVIARLESGEHSISLKTLIKIAHAVGKEVRLV
jgi:DNA-binding XRE family transcriptional regulator